jgi:hypothetical protein
MTMTTRPASAARAGSTPQPVFKWIGLCAAAEGVGMVAAACAAKAEQAWLGEPTGAREVAAVLTLAVAGGVVEGAALGLAQATGLGGWLPAQARRTWVAVTVLVAGLGWAAASVPGALAGGARDGAGGAPPWPWLLAGAAALGLSMGGLLGAAQARVLRGRVRHPWRWVTASVLGWAPAMAVIFVGASTPGAGWGVLPVLALAAATGVVAGAVLGAVTGWYLPSLSGPTAHDRIVVALLGSRLRTGLPSSLVALRVVGTVTGIPFELPVSAAAVRGGLVVLPGRADTKRWWRNLVDPAAVVVLSGGTWSAASGVVLNVDDARFDAALRAYLDRFPRVVLPLGSPLVLLTWAPPACRGDLTVRD